MDIDEIATTVRNVAHSDDRLGFPVTDLLSTSTDLPLNDIRAVIDPLIADAFALYVKTNGSHWHLAGAAFAIPTCSSRSKSIRSSPRSIY